MLLLPGNSLPKITNPVNPGCAPCIRPYSVAAAPFQPQAVGCPGRSRGHQPLRGRFPMLSAKLASATRCAWARCPQPTVALGPISAAWQWHLEAPWPELLSHCSHAAGSTWQPETSSSQSPGKPIHTLRGKYYKTEVEASSLNHRG